MGHHGGRGTTAAAMVHVNSQLEAKSTYVSYRELLPRGKIVRGHFFCAVACIIEEFLRPLAHMLSCPSIVGGSLFLPRYCVFAP